MSDLVSVIINCYNGEQFLKGAIQSVLSQTYSNWELIIWDNQSTDKSKSIVHEYTDVRIKYHYATSHTSLGDARNRAIKISCGKFISFLDCDDWWERDKIEKSLVKFDDPDVGLVYTNGYTFYESTKKSKLFYHFHQKEGFIFEGLISHYNIMIPSIMVKDEAIRSLDRIFNANYSFIEEMDLFIRLAQSWKVAYVHKPLCFWRAHKNSLTWSKKEQFEVEYLNFIEELVKEYDYLKNTMCYKHFMSKLSYHKFLNIWKYENRISRKILYPYLTTSFRVLGIYVISFFPLKTALKLLKYIGKEI